MGSAFEIEIVNLVTTKAFYCIHKIECVICHVEVEHEYFLTVLFVSN